MLINVTNQHTENCCCRSNVVFRMHSVYM